MITAHLPAGYVLSHAAPNRGPLVLSAFLIGSILPDLDLIWFYLIDNRAIHHHRYWVHAPAFWAMLAVPILPLAARLRLLPPALAFFAALLLHILLDTLVGSIMWLWPVSTELFQLVEVPATRNHWLLSFILHWTFLFELAIWATALTLFLKAKRVRRSA